MPASATQRPTGVALRFISCGVLSLCFGLLWKLTLAPHRVGVGSVHLDFVCVPNSQATV